MHGSITDFREDAGGIRFTADCSQAYPGAGCVLRQVRVAYAGWMLIHDSIEQPGEGIDFLFHTDNRDRQAVIEITPERILIRRPCASLLLLPLLGGTATDLGTEYLDSDPEGQRALRIQRVGAEMATLLVPLRPGQTADILPAGERAWRICVNGTEEIVALKG